jgi:hypothetical protein
MLESLIEKLNNLKIYQESYEWVDDLPEDMDKYFENKSPIMDGLDVEKHRWYETAIEVWEIDGEYLGVRAITTLYSEMSTIQDMFHNLEFFEMEQIEKISYKRVDK